MCSNSRSRHLQCLLGSAALAVLTSCALAPLPLTYTERVHERDGPALRIECKYDMQNCEREAKSRCHGSYAIVNRGEGVCSECGWSSNGDIGSGVYQGVLTVRCAEPPSATRARRPGPLAVR